MKMLLSRWASRITNILQTQADLRCEYSRIRNEIEARTPGNPAIYGYKIYSQCDEDGILAYIFSKIPNDGFLVEIGCGNGLENNTHALILNGWQGIWIDGNYKNIRYINKHIPKNKNLICECHMVSEENIVPIIRNLVSKFRNPNIDLLSVDIDSNDIYVLTALLNHTSPKVLCVEYNAKFPPPMEISVDRGTRRWANDDYHGASLAAFVSALHERGYKLISCNLSGANAFFVRNEYVKEFPQYNIDQLYQPARYDLIRIASGHKPSLKWLANRISRKQ